MKINDFKPGQIILFQSFKGFSAIGKIQSVNIENETVLCHDMILTKDFSKLRGKFGGLNIELKSIVEIIL